MTYDYDDDSACSSYELPLACLQLDPVGRITVDDGDLGVDLGAFGHADFLFRVTPDAAREGR